MRAAVVEGAGELRVVDDAHKPALKRSGVRVRVLRAHVLSFTNLLVDGYLPTADFPLIPGPTCIARVEEIGTEVTQDFKEEELVLCVPTIGEIPTGALQGWITYGTEQSKRCAETWKDGAFAEYACYPACNVYPLRGERVSQMPTSQLCLINYNAIALGALRNVDFGIGETVAIGGATGGLGMCTAAVALALGARRVYPIGRSRAVLDEIKALSPARVHPIIIPSDVHDDNVDLEHALGFVKRALSDDGEVDGVDVFADAFGGTPTARLTQAGINGVRHRGRVALFGGVRETLCDLNYADILFRELTIRGCFMYDSDAVTQILELLEMGTLRLDWVPVEEYSLNETSEAIARAAVIKGGFVSLRVHE